MRRAALALQDIVLLAYLSTVAFLLCVRAPAPGPAFWRLVGGTLLLLTTAVVARTVTRIPLRVRLGVYRVVIVAAIVWSYLLLRDVLPVVRTDTVDATLAAVDAWIFSGTEPALWLERLNRPAVVEWLAFFYFNYYTLNLVFVIGVLWIEGPRSPAAVEFGIGTALLFSIGHLGYMAVPAFGPVVYFADRYQGPLHGGFFLRLVIDSVTSGGALKDVFPSMHTGASVWYALFALHRARLDRRWRWPAAVSVFVVANIVVSTLVLRWHYVVDVLAGITLATAVAFAAARIGPWEEARRRRLGMPAVWSFE